MIVAKIAVWFDPSWRSAMGTKGNWHRIRYWYHRRKESTTIGPWRIDIKRISNGE